MKIKKYDRNVPFKKPYCSVTVSNKILPLYVEITFGSYSRSANYKSLKLYGIDPSRRYTLF